MLCTLTASYISIVGATGFATIVIPNTLSNPLLSITASAWINNIQFNSNGASTADGIDVSGVSAELVIKDAYIVGFNVGLNATAAETLVVENTFFTFNNTGIYLDDLQVAINGCIFENGGTGTGISITGSSAQVGFNAGILTGFSTAILASGGSTVAMDGTIFKSNAIGCSINGASTFNATAIQFNLNNATGNVTGILASDAGTIVRCAASIFSNPSTPSNNQVAFQVQDEASCTVTNGSINNYTTAFINGDDNGDTSGTILLIGAFTVSNCTNDIIQQGTTTLSVQASNIDITKISINDTTNVTFAYFDVNNNNRLNVGKYSNSYPDTDLVMAEVGRGEENPHIGYIPNIYGYRIHRLPQRKC